MNICYEENQDKQIQDFDFDAFIKSGNAANISKREVTEAEQKADLLSLKLKLHNLQINPRDLPPESGDMPKDMKPVLAYTKELGWTTAIRRKHNRKHEWCCFNYYGNLVFLDKEIIMWAELPEV